MSPEHVDTTGEMRDGALHVKHLKRFREAVKRLRNGPVLITVRRVHATRSLLQNSLYWIGYVQPLAEYTGYSKQAMHQYLKRRFLQPNHLVIADKDGVVIDEADLEPTTTTLNKVEFGEYLKQVEEFALELGVTVGPQDRELVNARCLATNP